MSNVVNAFIDIALRRDFALFHYIFYNLYVLFVLRISVDCLKDELKEQKKLKEIFKWGSLILISLIILTCLTIFESNGIFFYLCIFSWISTFAVIIWALIPEKFISNEPQHKKPKKRKNEKVKFNKSKNKLNLKNIKFKNQKGSIDATK